MNKRIEIYDVIIIGGGSAGLTAAIYCGRAKLNTLVIEKTLIGGLATYTNEIENYPGFPAGVTGSELMDLFYKQAKNFGVKFKFTDVKSVDFTEQVKKVETFRTQYQASVIIIAGGGKPRLTGADGENQFLYDKGISFCATCDAAANTDKTVIVIGSGDAAIEEGIFLTKFAKKVIVSIIHDSGKMDCNEIARTQALSNPKMEFMWNTVVDQFIGNDKLKTVVLKNIKTEQKTAINVDTCFLFIGYLPNTEIYQDILSMSKSGHLIANDKMETNIAGVFVAGDIREKYLKQVATAVGDGAIAGYSAEKYIAEQEIYEQQILNNGKPSLVLFYNSTDTNSHYIFPLLEKITIDYLNKVQVSLIDIYKSDGLAKRINVEQSPTIVYFNQGLLQKKLVGEITLDKIISIINY